MPNNINQVANNNDEFITKEAKSLASEIRMQGGIVASPYPVNTGEELRVVYDGLLAQSGADRVFMHMGYGPVASWSNTKDIEMMRTQRGFETTFRVDKPDRINFCFKDSAANWDNNNGLNWSI